MKQSFLPAFAIIMLSLAGIATFVGLMMDFSILFDLLNNNPYDQIEVYSLVSPATDMAITIVFILTTLFLILKGILSAIRLQYTTAYIYGIVSIALLVIQLFYYSLTTAHYG